MTYILAIDTTAGTGVALIGAGKLLAQVQHDSGVKHAELIGESIAQVFAQTGIRPDVLDAVAVGRGPALFTGLRVGIAAGVMFAEAVGANLVGVVSHDAIALEHYESDGSLAEEPLLITTDARRGEVYWALYGGLDADGIPITLAGPSVGKLEAVTEQLRQTYPSFAQRSSGAKVFWVASLAQRLVTAGRADSNYGALYLRAPDAALPKPNQTVGKRVSG